MRQNDIVFSVKINANLRYFYADLVILAGQRELP